MSEAFRIAAYNVEWFANLFDDNDDLILDNAWSARYDVTRRRQAMAVADAISAVDADLFLIVEAPNSGRRQSSARALERFAMHFRLRQSKALTGFANGTRQELTLLYDPDRVSARHDPRGVPFKPPKSGRRMRLEALGPLARAPRFDSILPLDIDGDGLVDLHEFSKPPIEAALTLAGETVRLIGVHAKSKAPHGARTAEDVVRIHVANRRKQLAQCDWIRRRVEEHLGAGEDVIVLGDFNDGPGIDRYERLFGRSGVEVVMGDVGAPEMLLRNPFVRARLHPDLGWRPATARFYNREKRAYMNALLDFVMVNAALSERAKANWRIWHPFDDPDLNTFMFLEIAKIVLIVILVLAIIGGVSGWASARLKRK